MLSLYRLCHHAVCELSVCLFPSEKTGKRTESEENRMVKPCQMQGKEGWFPLLHPTQLGTRSNAPIRVSKCQPELESAQASFSAWIKSKPPSKKSWGAPFAAHTGISTTLCSKALNWPRSASVAGSPRPASLTARACYSSSVPSSWGVPIYFISQAYQEFGLQPLASNTLKNGAKMPSELLPVQLEINIHSAPPSLRPPQ